MGTKGVQAQVEYSVGALANVSQAKRDRGAGGRRSQKGEESTFKTKRDKIKPHLLCNHARGQLGLGLSRGPGDRGHLSRVACFDTGIQEAHPLLHP